MAREPSDNTTDPYRQAFERSPLMQLVIDADSGRVLEANDAALTFHGCAIERLRQLRLSELLIPPEGGAGPLSNDLLSGRICNLPSRQRDGEGHLRDVEIDAVLIDDIDGRRVLHAIVRDVSDQVGIEKRLQVYSEFYEHLPVPLYRATRGATGRFIRFNPAFLKLFEAERPEQLFERDISDLYFDPRERERFSNQLMKSGKVLCYEMRLRTLTGKVIRCIDTAYQHEDENGQVVFDGVLEDVTRQRELEQKLAYQARYDDLTSLANRRFCDELLGAEFERCDRYGQPLSLLMLDLDHFKQVNDEWGHAAGDDLLQGVAECIRQHVRQTDIPGRWGGEEFVIVLPSTRERGAARLAEKLRQSIPAATGEHGHRVTASIGYGEYHGGEGREAFLARLDDALYAAKHAGRDRVCPAPVSASPDGRRSSNR